MKRLFMLLLLGLAIWYGWTQYPKLVERRPSHEALIENSSGGELRAVRVKVDGQTLVRETLEDGGRAALPFRVNQDASFQLEWRDANGERAWSGGMVPAGPMVQRHVFTIDAEGQVLYRAENK